MTMVGSGAYGSVRSASSPCWVRAPVAKDPARQQVDDLEQHPASQPSRRPACWRSGRSATRSSIRAAHDRPGDRSPPMICTAARRFRPGTRPRWPRPALPLPPSRTSGGGCPSCARPAPPASSCATHPSEVRGSGPGADAPLRRNARCSHKSRRRRRAVPRPRPRWPYRAALSTPARCRARCPGRALASLGRRAEPRLVQRPGQPRCEVSQRPRCCPRVVRRRHDHRRSLPGPARRNRTVPVDDEPAQHRCQITRRMSRDDPQNSGR